MVYNSAIRYNKFNFRANVDLNLTKSTVLNVNLANIYEKSFGPGYGDNDNDIWSYAFQTSPTPSRCSIQMECCPVRPPIQDSTLGTCLYTPVIANSSGTPHSR